MASEPVLPDLDANALEPFPEEMLEYVVKSAKSGDATSAPIECDVFWAIGPQATAFVRSLIPKLAASSPFATVRVLPRILADTDQVLNPSLPSDGGWRVTLTKTRQDDSGAPLLVVLCPGNIPPSMAEEVAKQADPLIAAETTASSRTYIFATRPKQTMYQDGSWFNVLGEESDGIAVRIRHTNSAEKSIQSLASIKKLETSDALTIDLPAAVLATLEARSVPAVLCEVFLERNSDCMENSLEALDGLRVFRKLGNLKDYFPKKGEESLGERMAKLYKAPRYQAFI